MTRTSYFNRNLGSAILLSALAIAGCTNVKEDPSGNIAITIEPGQTGSCNSSPCSINLVMPPGSGSYEVTANQVTAGTYPAGQTVNIGGFYQSQAIEVVGAAVPKAYVYIPNLP